MKVSEAFAAAGIQPQLDDSMFWLTCECGIEQHLDTMPLSSVADVTIYACAGCGNSLVGVKPHKADAQATDRGGYRMKTNVVGCRVDMFMRSGPTVQVMLLPATPHFFD